MEVEGVEAVAAVQLAGGGGEGVIAQAAQQGIPAGAAEQPIVAVATIDEIVAVAAVSVSLPSPPWITSSPGRRRSSPPALPERGPHPRRRAGYRPRRRH